LIAIDSSVLIAFLEGKSSPATAKCERAIADLTARLPMAVVAECLSAPGLNTPQRHAIESVLTLETTPDYWKRVGALRAKLLAKGHKAKLGDALIAQNCIDHHIPLLTTDTDFRHYTRLGLKHVVCT
jgi:predicted nucleic acid-binding protein